MARGWVPSFTLYRCIREAGKIGRCWGKRQAKEKRHRVEILQNLLGTAQLLLLEARILMIASLQLKVFEARDLLLTFNATQAEWVDYIIKARWMSGGDRSTRLSYKSFKSLAADKGVPELFDPAGNLVSSWEEMARISTAFFTNIPEDGPAACTLPIDADIFYEVLS